MNWKFWRKDEVVAKEGRRLQIPAEHVRYILELHDTAHKERSRATKYDLWAAIIEIFPEVKEGSWGIEFVSALDVFVVEQ